MAFRFQNFPVYKDAKIFHKKILSQTVNWPHRYTYLADQIKRSSLSIILNIAEGSSRQSDKDFNRYLSIALGSVDETIAGLEVTFDCKLLTEGKFIGLKDKGESLSKQLGGFSKMLRKNNDVRS